jgi:NAD(P)-dependent dehydrogenase (short-subunit alcohol dehydrogenase family)
MNTQKRVLVTGASSGIGRATALEFADRGHRVFLAARRAEELEQVAHGGNDMTPLPMDVTDEKSIQAAAQEIDEFTGGYGLDVLVNAAGYALLGPVEGLGDEAVKHQFETNVFGLLAVTRTFVPQMRERHQGRVINVSSVVGRMVFPGMGIYSATKFAIEALTDALRMELASFGVQVVLVEPGFVKTDIKAASQRQSGEFKGVTPGYEELMAKGTAFVEKQIAEKSIPPERVAKQIAQVAETAKPRARYVLPTSGKILVRVMGALPDGVADSAKRRTLGLSKRST